MNDFDIVKLVFGVVILIISVVAHEVAHGLAAYKLGDPTAKLLNRLSMNPIRHIDPIGSIILPAVTYMSGGFIFGWAKPVPYNPQFFKNPKSGEGIVAFAGPLMNISIAFITGLFLRFSVFIKPLLIYFNMHPAVVGLLGMIIITNLMLALFNLMPIPPLDGSKILFSFLPSDSRIKHFLSQYSLIIGLVFIFFVWDKIAPAAFFITRFLIGS